jgi:hypothetical protein
MGITKTQFSRSQRLAELDDEAFEARDRLWIGLWAICSQGVQSASSLVTNDAREAAMALIAAVLVVGGILGLVYFLDKKDEHRAFGANKNPARPPQPSRAKAGSWRR